MVAVGAEDILGADTAAVDAVGVEAGAGVADSRFPAKRGDLSRLSGGSTSALTLR